MNISITSSSKINIKINMNIKQVPNIIGSRNINIKKEQ